jgi:sec-independent protein translocase protein TatA
MFDPSAPHIIILLIVVLLLFGSRRLPGAAKSLGQSMHIFKQSVSGLNPEDPNDPNHNGASGFTANSAALPPATPSAQPLPSTQDATQSQLQDLQRQVEELQRQSASGSAGQQNQPF